MTIDGIEVRPKSATVFAALDGTYGVKLETTERPTFRVGGCQRSEPIPMILGMTAKKEDAELIAQMIAQQRIGGKDIGADEISGAWLLKMTGLRWPKCYEATAK